MKINKITTIFITLIITGCVNREAILVHPETGQQQFCSNSGWGWLGAPMAASAHNRCVSNLRAQGYQSAGLSQYSKLQNPSDPATGAEWSVRLAKQKYKSGDISRLQYEHIIRDLKLIYRAKVQAAEDAYDSGLISKKEYKQKVLDAKYQYAG